METEKKTPYCKVFDNDDFGYCRITVERPKHSSIIFLPSLIGSYARQKNNLKKH